MLWTPKEDITIWELAVALNVLLPAVGGNSNPASLERVFNTLPDQVKRHFTFEQ